MATAQQQQDVIIKRDGLGRIMTVDRYAKALDIKNPEAWEYIVAYADFNIVHHTELLGDNKLDVRGEQIVTEFIPNSLYTVFFELQLLIGAVGFGQPVVFSFIDQNDNMTTTAETLKTGTNMVTIGQFRFDPAGNRNVSAKLIDIGTLLEKKGLVVCRMGITLAN